MNFLTATLMKRIAMLMLAGVIGLVAILYGYQLGHDLLEKYPPDWTLFGSVKAAALLFATWIAYRALRPQNELMRPMNWHELPSGSLSIGVSILLASAAAVLLVPDQISGFVRESEPVSIVTDYVLAAALFALGYAIVKARGSEGQKFLGLRPVWSLSLMFGVVFLILMEEMSWGQHLIGWSTPETFNANIQNETNIHNFYTHRFEAAYYTAAVLAFMVLPFAWPNKLPNVFSGFSIFVPPPAFAIMALPVCGLMFETWNYVPFQMWFYFGILITLHYWFREQDMDRRAHITLMGSALLLSQLVFIRFGHTMIDGHELTEIREFAISLIILTYGYIMAVRFKNAVGQTAQSSQVKSTARI